MNDLQVANFANNAINTALLQLEQIIQQLNFVGLSEQQKQEIKKLKNDSVEKLWLLREYVINCCGIDC